MPSGEGVRIPLRHFEFKSKVKIPVCVEGHVTWLSKSAYKRHKAKLRAKAKIKTT